MASFVSRRFLSTTARRLANQTEEKAAAEASNGPALVRIPRLRACPGFAPPGQVDGVMMEG